MFLKISQISQEKNCAGIFFNKVACLRSATLMKRTPVQVFSSGFCDFFKSRFYRTPPRDCF